MRKMNLKVSPAIQTLVVSALSSALPAANAQAVWRLDTRSAAGPVAQVALPEVGQKHRTSLVAFEYARRCDPIFSFAEMTGARYGTPISQAVLTGTKIGVVVNGRFHTWHAATTKYDNGYEAGFGVSNELFDILMGRVDKLEFVTPEGERVAMPVDGFRQSVKAAADACVKRFK